MDEQIDADLYIYELIVIGSTEYGEKLMRER